MSDQAVSDPLVPSHLRAEPGGAGAAVPDRVVAVLGRGVVAPDAPVLRADDLGVLRGDGVFETLHVRAGRPWLLDEHLVRMAGSAARLQIGLPERAALADLAAQTCAAWPADREGALRLVCTRGPESPPGGTPAPATVFATLGPVPAGLRASRREGVAVATATLGVPARVRAAAPWLLGGVKSLSYAVNMASQRWAAGQGLDDVLWVSADGYALEAPTSSLVWLADRTLCTVPPAETGILAGTTARWLLAHAGALGFGSAERMVRPEDLAGADGVWLTSSVRGPAPVRALDGAPLPRSPHTGPIRELLGYPA